ncbi:MAG: class I SAM-dependent methyltransferase [Lachnospiraceae bacterium]|nr:class I SAM-dependent methyltransferase [Lachnospiraceae bacterium]
MDNTNNKEYWNDYVTYWENRVKDTNEGKEVKDKTNDDSILEAYFEKLDVKKDEVLLDYGCGSGRLYTIYNKEYGKGDNYFGIDVSGVCLEHAQEKNKRLSIGKNLKEFDGLHIPFNDSYFDKIICFGVFDACNQEKVIEELFRVLKKGGRLLITGKNNKYYEDDKAALVAEVNARKKGHPNYFTDVHDFTIQLKQHNVKVLEKYYFLRRGDFPRNQAVQEIPEIFYEWAYIMEKTDQYKDYEYQKFSDKYSKVKSNL